MPRISTRRPTLDDLDQEQREMYSALPEGMRDRLLDMLPGIRMEGASGAGRKAQTLRQRLDVVETLLERLTGYRDHIADIAGALEGGKIPATEVDLRDELGWPEVGGVTLKNVRRGRRNGRTAEETEAPAEEEAAEEGQEQPTRRIRIRGGRASE